MKRDAFLLPRGIYLDGNSLGPLSYGAQAATERRLKQWQHLGVGGWDEWFELAERLSPALVPASARVRAGVEGGELLQRVAAGLRGCLQPTGEVVVSIVVGGHASSAGAAARCPLAGYRSAACWA